MLMDLQEKDMGAHKKIPVNKTPKLTVYGIHQPTVKVNYITNQINCPLRARKHKHYLKIFPWEPEGCYHCTKSMTI